MAALVLVLVVVLRGRRRGRLLRDDGAAAGAVHGAELAELVALAGGVGRDAEVVAVGAVAVVPAAAWVGWGWLLLRVGEGVVGRGAVAGRDPLDDDGAEEDCRGAKRLAFCGDGEVEGTDCRCCST